MTVDDGQSLAGAVALVTGAASGIGRATAAALVGAGARLVAVDVDAAGLATLVAEHAPLSVRAVTHDLLDTSGIAALVDAVLAAEGRIGILVNVAGIPGEVSLSSPLLDYTDDDWDRVMTVNLKAPFVLIRHVGRHMVERGGGGKIVSVSSSSAFRALNHSNAEPLG